MTAHLATSVYTVPTTHQSRIYIDDLPRYVPHGTRVYLYQSGSTFEVGWRTTSCRFSRQDAWDAADEALNAAGLSYGDSWEAVVAAATGTTRQDADF